MKKNLNDFKRLLLTACCTLVLSCGWATVNEKPFVIPELKQWSGAEGMFTPSGKYVVKGGKNAQPHESTKVQQAVSKRRLKSFRFFFILYCFNHKDKKCAPSCATSHRS